MQTFSRFMQDKTGATAIEYGLIAALISVALIAGFGSFSDSLVDVFKKIATAMADAPNS
ncbi:pilus assembly protein Flp/PilA [Pararhizobium capsulatum DSM 1112]|uniref:Pilus assembly protein Flp/PilA n=1 Tax=Pararhizobium capsulatum DSM 1112 TaxID=1121113 RepID=A0ABU0BTK7_9HYPH|nr:Flp family type IVb pilin [Pararhizobium capsulatum]MDQ0321589.1 pilus assembly protein Flp/PilA [Pararhizobium capsulatum DSM 1112]